MDSLAVALYKQRREERLAARGIKIKKKQYRKTKDLKRLNKPDVVKAFRKDADGDADDQQNESESTGGGHGNTRLPFGLCKKYGIEVGESWTPRDAWDALAGKGITPGEIYKKLKSGEELGPDLPEPPKKDPVKTIDSEDGKTFYTDLHVMRGWSSRGSTPYRLVGTPEWYESVPEDDRYGYRSSYLGRFATMTDMYLYLKKKGVEEFTDPDTGEIVNPVEMELPHVAYTDGERGYSAITLGMRGERYVLTGTDFEGKKKAIDDFSTLDGAKYWLDSRGVSTDDVKMSPALKKREAERTEWLTSDKKKYIEIDGTKYGDLHVTKDKYGSDLILHGSSEGGVATDHRFSSEADLMRFLKDSGVEDVRMPDRKHKNPMEEDVPDAVATLDGRYYQSFRFGLSPSGRLTFYGTGLDGIEYRIEGLNPYSSETTSAFMERTMQKTGLDKDKIPVDDDAKELIERKRKEEEEVDRRRREFPDKAVPVCGGMYMDLRAERVGDTYRLIGYDEYGREQRIAGYRDMASLATDCVDRFGLNPDEVFRSAELKDEYTKVKERLADFDARAITLGSYKYVDVGVEKEGDEYRLVGYDSGGHRRRLTSSYGDFEDVKEDAERRYGIGDSFDQYVQDPEVKKEYEAHKTRMAEFESKAVTVHDDRFIDVQVEPYLYDSSEFIITGYDKKGRKCTPIYGSSDMYDTVKKLEQAGLNPEDMMKMPDVKQAYSEYKKDQEKFEAESIPFDGERYADMVLSYDGSYYYVLGTDAKGRRRRIKECTTAAEIERFIADDPDHAFTFESIPKAEDMKERMEVIKKVKSAIDSGEYKDMGVDGSAFKSIHADKIGDKWSIKGVDIDGQEKQIAEASDWDDAIDMMERHGVTDYKMLTKDRTYSRPTDGMRHVVLMRSTDGSFRVYADSDSKGTHAEVYATSSEDDARKWLEDNNVSTAGVRTRGMNPNDDVPRTHTQSSLAKFDTYRMEKIENSFVDRMTDDEKKEAVDMLTEIFSVGSYRVARSTSSFGGIIENGYKSQIETGTGGAGAFKGKEGRKAASDKFYGHGGLPDTEYEKCGYIGYADEAEDWDSPGHPFYGGSSPMTYTLRKETLKDRTTYTYGDSLNTRYNMTSAGYAGDKPTIEGVTSLDSLSDMRSILQVWRKYKSGQINFSTMFNDIRRYADNRYIELQFHGPVTVKDIEKISFEDEDDLKQAFNHMKPERRKRVVKALMENNVGILYRKNSRSEFIDGWDWVRQNYPEAFATEA